MKAAPGLIEKARTVVFFSRSHLDHVAISRVTRQNT